MERTKDFLVRFELLKMEFPSLRRQSVTVNDFHLWKKQSLRISNSIGWMVISQIWSKNRQLSNDVLCVIFNMEHFLKPLNLQKVAEFTEFYDKTDRQRSTSWLHLNHWCSQIITRFVYENKLHEGCFTIRH